MFKVIVHVHLQSPYIPRTHPSSAEPLLTIVVKTMLNKATPIISRTKNKAPIVLRTIAFHVGSAQIPAWTLQVLLSPIVRPSLSRSRRALEGEGWSP